MTAPRNALLLALAPALLALAAVAAASPFPPRERRVATKQTDDWIAGARAIQERLGKGEFAAADREATALLGDMLQTITVGPDAGRLLALPLSLRAVARAVAPRIGTVGVAHAALRILLAALRSGRGV